MNKKALYFPVLLAFLLFAADKIFLFESVRNSTTGWSRFEPLLYESRKDLFEKMKKDASGGTEAFILNLGSSRSAGLSQKQFRRILSEKTPVYNFSVPLSSYDFHCYWLEKILDSKIRLRAVILEADPVLFSPEVHRYAFSYSLDIPYVLSHTGFRRVPENPYDYRGGYSPGEALRYIFLRLFASYRYDISLGHILENNRPIFPAAPGGTELTVSGNDVRKDIRILIQKAVQEDLGGMSSVQLPGQERKKDLKADALRFFSPLRINAEKPALLQAAFFNRILDALAEKQIPVLIYVPLNSPEFEELLDQKAARAAFLENLRRIQKRSPELIQIYIPAEDPDFSCTEFVDAVHMNGKCMDRLAEKTAGMLRH